MPFTKGELHEAMNRVDSQRAQLGQAPLSRGSVMTAINEQGNVATPLTLGDLAEIIVAPARQIASEWNGWRAGAESRRQEAQADHQRQKIERETAADDEVRYAIQKQEQSNQVASPLPPSTMVTPASHASTTTGFGMGSGAAAIDVYVAQVTARANAIIANRQK